MQARAFGIGAAHLGDFLAPGHDVLFLDQQFAVVGIYGKKGRIVPQHDQVAIAPEAGAGIGDDAIRRGQHRIAGLAGNVDTLAAAFGVGGHQSAVGGPHPVDVVAGQGRFFGSPGLGGLGLCGLDLRRLGLGPDFNGPGRRIGLARLGQGVLRPSQFATLRLALENLGVGAGGACGRTGRGGGGGCCLPYLDRGARDHRLRHGHGAAVWRRDAQLLADPDQVEVFEVVPRRHVLVIQAVIERDAVERLAFLDDVVSAACIACNQCRRHRQLGLFRGRRAAIHHRRRRVAGTATDQRQHQSQNQAHGVHSTPGNSGTKRTASKRVSTNPLSVRSTRLIT